MKHTFVDTHCHIDTYQEHTQESFESLWERIENKPERIIQVACDPNEFEFARQISKKHPFIYSSYGIHPHYVQNHKPEHLELLKKYLKDPKAVGIGEFGLDYYYGKENKKEQIALFKAQLEIALTLKKTIVLHLRDAEADSLEILNQYPLQKHKIDVHCYTSHPDFAKALLDYSPNLYIGFTGIITFKNAENVRESAKIVPLDKLLLETDAPYLAPVPYRGKPAHSGMIPHIAQTLAQIKNTSIENIFKHCRQNTENCYSI